jgi:hypothetical protein
LSDWQSVATKQVVVPAHAGIKYAAASRFYHRRLWNTGSPGQGRAMTAAYVSAFSRRDAPEVCWKLPALPSEGAGKTGCALHPRSRVRFAQKTKCTRAYRFSGNTPAFPAQWLYGLLRALPGEPSTFATVVSGIASTNLTPASGRQDHTTSPYASVALVSRNISVHRNPSLVRDDGQRPSERDGMAIDVKRVGLDENRNILDSST